MAVDGVLFIRAKQEQASSEQTRQKAEDALRRIHQAAENIRRMTDIYRARLEGGKRIAR